MSSSSRSIPGQYRPTRAYAWSSQLKSCRRNGCAAASRACSRLSALTPVRRRPHTARARVGSGPGRTDSVDPSKTARKMPEMSQYRLPSSGIVWDIRRSSAAAAAGAPAAPTPSPAHRSCQGEASAPAGNPDSLLEPTLPWRQRGVPCLSSNGATAGSGPNLDGAFAAASSSVTFIARSFPTSSALLPFFAVGWRAAGGGSQRSLQGRMSALAWPIDRTPRQPRRSPYPHPPDCGTGGWRTSSSRSSQRMAWPGLQRRPLPPCHRRGRSRARRPRPTQGPPSSGR